jgi:hypothetical protein
MDQSSRSRAAASDLLVFFCYVLLTLLMTYPVVVHLTTRLVGQGGDPWVHYWNTWWVGKALTEAKTPYYTDMLFHPLGASLVYHNFAWLNIIASLALRSLGGAIGAYNIISLLNVALCGYAMYDLVKYLLGRRSPAFVAGLVHAFWPYRLSHLNHPNLISSQWVVWFLLYLMRAVREGRRRHVLLCALFLVLTALARWQLLILAVFLGALYILYSLCAEREHWNRRTVGRLAAVGVLAGLTLAYPIFPLVREQIVGDYPDDLFIDEQALRQTDPLTYVTPNIRHPLRELGGSRDLRTDVAFIGYAVLALAGYGAIRAGRRARLWLLIAAFSFVMALGPYLRLRGQVYTDLPLPYQLLGWSPPVRVLRNPHRFNILLSIPVAVLTAHGVFHLSKRRAHLAPLAAAGLILFEYLSVPLPTLTLAYSPFYDQLAATPGRFGLYDLPMGFSGAAKFYMYLQTIHGKPLVEGKMARPERTVNDFINSDPFTEHLRLTNEMDPELTAISRHLAHLADHDVRYLILHRDPQLQTHSGYPTPERWADWQDWLTIEPFYQDDRIAVYHTRPRYGRDFDFALDLDADVGIIRAGPIPTSLSQSEMLELELRWGSRAAPTRDLTAQLSLVDEVGIVQQSLQVPPCGDWPTSDWPAGAVASGRYLLQIGSHLPSGQYTLTIELVGVGQPTALGRLTIVPLPRTFEPPEQITHPLDVCFGDALRLLGYDLARHGDTLTLTLHWQALRRMDTSYKVFVHLFDPTTNVIVAQDDAVPRRWTYPTTWWQEDEVISDPIPLSLADVPPGIYRLAIGVYRPERGERLSLLLAGASAPDNRLILDKEIAR